MLISIAVHSRGTIHYNKHIISCFLHQTYQQRELVFVVDEKFTSERYQEWLNEITDNQWEAFLKENNIRIFTLLDSVFIPHNVSSMRNFAIHQARGTFINLMDDDEDFPADYLEKSLAYWEKYTHLLNKKIIITPTLMYRHTWTIQNQWFSDFNYRLSRPIPCVLWDKEYDEIKMYSWNSLFWPKIFFENVAMDERFDFVYEDLDYSYSLFEKWYSLVVLKDLKIYHMERDKTSLEQAWVGNIYQAYRKANHRMIFVKKHASSKQKVQFYCLWFRGQPLRLSLKIVLFWTWNQRRQILKAIRRGTRGM